jgi:hypothetical protein
MTRATARPPWATIVAVAAVVSLALWPVRIDTAFGLPAHPLIIHVPVIFVPVLGLATLAVAFNAGWLDRYGLLVAAFGVLTTASTLLAAGAGEVFRERQERKMPELRTDPTMHDHADAGITLRLSMILLAAALVALPFTRRRPRVALRVIAALLALNAIWWVIRTGHLGAKLAWGT